MAAASCAQCLRCPHTSSAACSPHATRAPRWSMATRVAAAAAVQPPPPPPPPQQQQQSSRQQHQQQQQSQTELQRQVDVMQALSQWADSTLPQYMAAAEQQWQPSSVLPNLSSPGGLQQLAELRQEAQKLPTDILVVLAGLTVHAVLVPSQLASSWASAPVLRDHSGADQHAWARWRRQWAADMNKVRSALSAYCYCCGAIDTRALDVSSHVTLSSAVFNGADSSCAVAGGLVPRHGNSKRRSTGRAGVDEGQGQAAAAAAAAGDVVGLPYQQLFRELLQARMLRVMSENLTSLANYHGAPSLARLTAASAADLKQHELCLLAVCCRVIARDPQGAVPALAAVVANGVKLPGCWMDDGWHAAGNAGTAATAAAAAAAAAAGSIVSSGAGGSGSSGCGSSLLYQDWMAAADCVGALGVSDTAAAVQDLCSLLKVSELQAKYSGDPAVQAAAAALLAYPGRLRRLAEVQLEGRLRERRRGRTRSVAFSWVHGRDVLLA